LRSYQPKIIFGILEIILEPCTTATCVILGARLGLQGCCLGKTGLSVWVFCQLAKRQSLSDSATPQNFRRDGGRRFRIQKLKRFSVAALTVADIRGKNAKFPIQIWIFCRCLIARFCKWKGLIDKALLK
jgi:hypothetical protein